jgi:hypothetical protein
MAHEDPARSGKALAKVPDAIVALTRKEADALTDAKAAERIVLIGSEYKRLAGTAVEFVAKHREEILSMRARYSQPGRRNPVPGCPTWEEVVEKHFRVSYSHISRLLAPPKERKPSPSVPRGEGPEVATEAPMSPEQTGPSGPTAANPAVPVPAVVDTVAHKVATVVAGDYQAMADLWLQFLRPLPSSKRLGVLVRFFLLLPASYRSAVMWSITSPRVTKNKGIDAIAPEQSIEAIMELWKNELSPLDEAGRLKAFRSFLKDIQDRDRPLLARALGEAQDTPELGNPERRGRPSWDSIAKDWRMVFSSDYDVVNRYFFTLEEIGDDHLEDLLAAALARAAFVGDGKTLERATEKANRLVKRLKKQKAKQ